MRRADNDRTADLSSAVLCLARCLDTHRPCPPPPPPLRSSALLCSARSLLPQPTEPTPPSVPPSLPPPLSSLCIHVRSRDGVERQRQARDGPQSADVQYSGSEGGGRRDPHHTRTTIHAQNDTGPHGRNRHDERRVRKHTAKNATTTHLSTVRSLPLRRAVASPPSRFVMKHKQFCFCNIH